MTKGKSEVCGSLRSNGNIATVVPFRIDYYWREILPENRFFLLFYVSQNRILSKWTENHLTHKCSWPNKFLFTRINLKINLNSIIFGFSLATIKTSVLHTPSIFIQSLHFLKRKKWREKCFVTALTFPFLLGTWLIL